MRGLPKQRLCAQHMDGEKFPGRRQSARAPLDQLHSELPLHLSDVFRNRGLADTEVLRGPGKRAAADKTSKGTKAGSQLHN